jgi:hypothetical protein
MRDELSNWRAASEVLDQAMEELERCYEEALADLKTVGQAEYERGYRQAVADLKAAADALEPNAPAEPEPNVPAEPEPTLREQRQRLLGTLANRRPHMQGESSSGMTVTEFLLTPSLRLALKQLRANPGVTAWETRKAGPGNRLYKLEELGLAERRGSAFYPSDVGNAAGGAAVDAQLRGLGVDPAAEDDTAA